MIKISQFIGFLQPTNNRDVLETEYDNLQKELTRFNIPLFEQATKDLKNYKFKNEFVRNMEVSIEQVCKIKIPQNFLHAFLDISKKINQQMPFISDLIDRHFEEDVSIHSLDLTRINVLRYIPIMSFVARYMRAFTNYGMALEINTQSDDQSIDLIPADRNWLASNRSAFLQSCRLINEKVGNIEKIFEELPEVNIDPSNAKTVETTLGVNETDPMGMGFIPLSINPFYMVRKIISNYQVERYHLAEEELKGLKLKVYNLKLINEHKNDPKIQREINYHEENRIRPLNEKIQKMERDYGITT